MTVPANSFTCPACGLSQNALNARCVRCGTSFAEAKAPIEPAALSREGWRALGIGFGLAVVLSWIPFTRILFFPLITIAHELGHAVVAWVFGYPAVPAFDFTYGGGVTAIEEERKIPILIVVYLLMAYAGWRVRRHLPTLIVVAALIVLHSWIAFTDWHEVLILSMGHGTELVIAGIFLYRAMSGDAVLRVDERPAYAMAAFLILFHDVGFGWSLARSDIARELYDEGKGGMLNDFTQVQLYTRWTVATLGRWMVMGCGVTLILAWLAHRYQQPIASWWDRALTPVPSPSSGEGTSA